MLHVATTDMMAFERTFSPTAHPMLIGRERNLPVICGVRGLLERMLPYVVRLVCVPAASTAKHRCL